MLLNYYVRMLLGVVYSCYVNLGIYIEQRAYP